MGEIADAMIDGVICVYCGTYFQEGDVRYLVHDDSPQLRSFTTDMGVPCVCEDCVNK